MERLQTAYQRMWEIATAPRDATQSGRLGAADLRTELISLQHLESLYLTAGQAVDVPAEWSWVSIFLAQGRLDAELRKHVAGQSLRQLRVMLDLFSWDPSPGSTDLARMEKILKWDEFAQADREESPSAALMRRVRAYLAGRLGRLHFDTNHPAVQTAYEIVFILILTGLAGALGWLVYARWPRKRAAAAGGVAAARVEPLPDSRELSRCCGEAERGGRLREALHYAYLALVAVLGEREIVPRLTGRTNWEILRLLSRERRGNPALSRLDAINRLYDRVWYGQEDFREDEVRHALHEMEEARTELLA